MAWASHVAFDIIVVIERNVEITTMSLTATHALVNASLDCWILLSTKHVVEASHLDIVYWPSCRDLHGWRMSKLYHMRLKSIVYLDY